MLSEQLLELDDNINYQMYWEKTIMFRVFKKKYPSEAWKAQLKRIKLRK